MVDKLPPCLLRSLRNELRVGWILDVVEVPVKLSEGYLRFLCPLCEEFNTATNQRTNLARCFRCRQNFNPIDLVMIVKRVNFAAAVELLRELRERPAPTPLPRRPR